MITPVQLMIYAGIGAVLALVLLRAEDKFNNKQYTRGQYMQAAIAGFLITLVPVWLLSRSSITTGLVNPSASKPMHAPVTTAQPPAASSSCSAPSMTDGGSAFFTPIVNAITPKMQYRTSGPTF